MQQTQREEVNDTSLSKWKDESESQLDKPQSIDKIDQARFNNGNVNFRTRGYFDRTLGQSYNYSANASYDIMGKYTQYPMMM